MCNVCPEGGAKTGIMGALICRELGHVKDILTSQTKNIAGDQYAVFEKKYKTEWD